MQATREGSLWSRLCALAVAAAAMCLFLAAPGSAQAQDDYFYYDGVNYHYHIYHVPDFDQLRSDDASQGVLGLPNGGAMYCVPTAAMNWMGYIANHGYPNLPPGVADYASEYPALYNAVTAWDTVMGALMGTDPFNGTGDGVPGLQAYLDLVYPGAFVVIEDWAQGDHGITAATLSYLEITGCLVDAGIGWYLTDQVLGAFIRDGGHHVTLVGGDSAGFGSPGDMTIHDPVSNDSPTTQSAFKDDLYNIEDVTAPFGNLDSSSDPDVDGVRTQTRLVGYHNGILDNYYAIAPQWGLAATDSSVTTYYSTQIVPDTSNPPTTTFTLPQFANLLDIAIDPIRIQHPFLLKDSDDLWLLDQLTGQMSGLTRVMHPKHLAVGGARHRYYIATDTALVALHDDGRPLAARPTPDPLDAVLCDGSVRKVVGYSLRTSSLYLFDEELRLPAVQIPLPGVVSPGGAPAPVQLVLDMPNHGYLLHVDGSPFVTRVMLGGSRPVVSRVSLPNVSAPVGLASDRLGNLFTTGIPHDSRTPVIYAFDANGRRISSPFAGKPGGRLLKMLMPYSNFDPQTMHGPSFYNVLPPGPNGR